MSRRNSRRLGNQPQTPTKPTPPQPKQADNPFGMSFVVGKEVVNLPSKGKYYLEDSSLHGHSTVEIKHLTAKEEDVLGNEEYIKNGTVFDKLLRSILVDKSIDPDDFLDGDKLAVLAAARITGYGPEYETKTICEACGKETEFTFDLEKMISDTTDQEIPDGVTEVDGIFEFKISTKDLTVGIRLINGHDSQYLREQSDRRDKLNVEGSETIDYLNLVVDHVNEIRDTELLLQLFEVLPLKDIRKIRKVYASVMPNPKKMQSCICKNCEASVEREVPFTMGWFWPDISVS